jgi:hypothetical protein
MDPAASAESEKSDDYGGHALGIVAIMSAVSRYSRLEVLLRVGVERLDD